MFTKLYRHLYRNAGFTKTFLYNKAKILVLFKMKKFTLCRSVYWIRSRNFFSWSCQASRLLYFCCRLNQIETVLVDNRSNGRHDSIQKFQTLELSSSRSFLQFRGNLQGKSKEYQGKKLVGWAQIYFNLLLFKNFYI